MGGGNVPTGGRRDPTRYVLLIEDDVAVREAIAELLLDVGYPVVTASNGGEALELMVLHGPPALILLDLIMPVMAGFLLKPFTYDQLLAVVDACLGEDPVMSA